MKVNEKDLMENIIEILDAVEYIKPEDIPNIDLYMDQVTTLMDGRLRKNARYPDGDKIMTKTMINNYAKNDLLPPPLKKKYSKEHILVLLFIYYFKSFLSISDIQTLLDPITGRFFGKEDGFGLTEVYEEVFSMTKDNVEKMKRELKETCDGAENSFSDAPEEDRDLLQKFAFICSLSFDIYVRKMVIEKMLDEVSKDHLKSESGEKEAKKESKKAKNEK